MSTHNICFRREIRKILCGYPLLSVALICIMIQYHHKTYHDIYRYTDNIAPIIQTTPFTPTLDTTTKICYNENLTVTKLSLKR